MVRSLVFAVVSLLLAATFVPVAAAGAVLWNDRWTQSGETYGCSGEPIQIETQVHSIGRRFFDAQGAEHYGSMSTIMFHATTESGARYVGQEHYTSQNRLAINGRTDTETLNIHVILLGEDGTADDLRIRAIYQLTINANYELVHFKFEYVTECA